MDFPGYYVFCLPENGNLEGKIYMGGGGGGVAPLA